MIKKRFSVKISYFLIVVFLINIFIYGTSLEVNATSCKTDYKIEIILAVGDTDKDVSNFEDDLRSKLEKKGFKPDDIRIDAVEESTISTNDYNASDIFNNWVNFPKDNDTYKLVDGAISSTSNSTEEIGYYDPTKFKCTDCSIKFDAMTRQVGQAYGMFFRISKDKDGMYSFYALHLSSDWGGKEQSNPYQMSLWKVRKYPLDEISKTASMPLLYRKSGEYLGYNEWGTPSFNKNEIGVTKNVRNLNTEVTLLQAYEFDIADSLNDNEWINATIKATKNHIEIYRDEDKILNYIDNEDPLDSGTYAIWALSNEGIFFKNVSIFTKTTKSLSQVLEKPNWNSSSKKFIINLNDKEEECLSKIDMFNDTVVKLNQDEVHYIGWGGNDAGIITNKLISEIDNRGTFINTNIYEEATNQITEYIESKCEDLKQKDEPIINDPAVHNNWPDKPKKSDQIQINKGSDVVNIGEKETKKNSDGNLETIVTIDDNITENLELSEGERVTIPIKSEADIVKCILHVQDIKDLKDKKARLQVETNNVVYELPTELVDIDLLSEEIGKDVDLNKIKFVVNISNTRGEMKETVESATKNRNLSVIMPSVDFEIEASHKGNKCNVNKFRGYVNRLIKVPSGIDKSKITTAIVTSKDGTIRHIPTYVTKVNSDYYAKINSLSNSTYTLIFNEEILLDVPQNHWARKDIEKVVNKLIIDKKQDDMFEPEGTITMGELVKIVVKALGIKTENDKIKGYLDAAVDYGIVDVEEIEVDKIATRQDAMNVIYSASNAIGLEIENKENVCCYKDYDFVDEKDKEATQWNIQKGIVVGKSSVELAPYDNITRAEISATINRFLGYAQLIE